ncbi:hypothetical protein [Caballeronia sp. SL2Y3]|uniref:hypothetical protein n=1 Tax=Caballeronia sp. SL2Y3 TaxID=2878151 RepID=UPI00351D328D
MLRLVTPSSSQSATIAARTAISCERRLPPVNDIDALEARLKGAAPAWLAFDMRLMMQRYLEDGAVATPQQIERTTSLLGRAPRSYRDFAAETASEWANQ